MRILIPFIILAFLVSTSCNKDNRSEEEVIAEFIAANNLEGEFMTDGIFVSIDNPGNGAHPEGDDTVEVFYEGKYASDSKVFDGNLGGSSISFPLTGVIPGWTKGLPYFGVGDKGWLILPANQGYGSFPPGSIRSNAVLAFYIELVSIK